MPDHLVAELYREHRERLERYAMSLTHDTHRTDDLVQETLVRAISHLRLLERLNPYQRRAWLYRTLKNRFLDEQRREQRQRTLFSRLAKDAARADRQAVPGRLYELLDRVPERYRDVLYKRYALGMTSSEIGRDLGIPAATVRSRLHLAISRLRREGFKKP